MPDEAPPEQQAGEIEQTSGETQAATEPEEAPKEQATAEPETELEVADDKEPGGSDGQAVYQRKLYRQAKQAREEAQREREARIAAEARAKAIEEAAAKSPPPPEKQIFSVEQIEAAVNSGQISREDAEIYKAKTLTPYLVQQEIERRERERVQAEEKRRPLETASSEVSQYVKLAPWVMDRNDPRRVELDTTAKDIMQRYGLAYSPIVEALTLRQVLGPIDKLAERKRMGSMTREGANLHAEAGAGGGRAESNAKDPASKVPAEMVASWRQMGATEEQIKKYAAHHLEKLTLRRSRLGG